MIAEIKRGLKLIKYGHGLKMNVIAGILFWIIGIIMCCGPMHNFEIVGVVYIIMGPLMLIQLNYTLLYSGFVGASPRRRLLEIVIPDCINIVTGLLGYLVIAVTTMIKTNQFPENTQDNMVTLLIAALSAAALVLCFAAAYKYYWLSMILFFVVFFAMAKKGQIMILNMGLNWNVVNTSLLSLLIVVLAIVLSCLIRRALYKKPMSPIAAGSNLRKAMQ